MNHRLTTTLSLAGLALCLGTARAADPPRVLELRSQKVEGITYFQVRLERPTDLRLPAFDTSRPFSEVERRLFARLPRLVPQDGKARAVYYRQRQAQPGLNFCGLQTGAGKARFVLLYPLAETESPQLLSLADLMRSPVMVEVPVEVDFATAVAVPLPKIDADDQHLNSNDLRARWALHQAAHFAALETQVIDFNFYGFAREATGRKYGVVSPAWVKRDVTSAQHRLYDITTGADAIAETLQLHRLLQTDAKLAEKRSIHIADVQGVTVPQPPWEQMLAGKKPVLEPLASFIPADNYYVHFRNLRKFIEFGELLDQWGTSALRVYEMKSRDCRLRERYEKQLCLKSTALGKALGPALVKGLAVTGNDPYIREGTDVTVIFHVANRPLFLAAVGQFLEEARQQYGKRLREQREKYKDIEIESFVAPLREVSLYRAVVDDFVLYSNSPVGIRRALDTYKGKGLAQASDFRYMRTLFRSGDESEDGFVYLSDAFIRQLTGPASRIKEKRRLEALTSMQMLTNAALFHAWETGKLPPGQAEVLAGAGLRPEDVAVPEGKAIQWEGGQQLPVSDVYNTFHFATPLIELPIERVTPTEATDYGRFREVYAKLYRTYFDPIGIRLSLDDKRVRIETHILPLAASEPYRALRNMAGTGGFRFQPRKEGLFEFRLGGGDNASIGLHLDETALVQQMIELLIRWEADPRVNLRQEYDKLFWKLPLGVSLSGVPAIENDNAMLVNFLQQAIGKEQPSKSRYKEVQIVQLPISAEKFRQAMEFLNQLSQAQQDQFPFAALLALLPTKEAPAALHIAAIDKTVFVSPNEAFVKNLIDQHKKVPEKKPAEQGREVNAGLFLSPANAGAAGSLFLEYEGHSLALLNNQVWNAFHQCGLLTADSTPAVRQDTARRFLGFVPVSPDGSPYRYDARLGEVLNTRHGSLRRPEFHSRVAEGSELAKLLEQIKGIRAELRFEENALHTVVTIERR